ncbi:Crp/Fnr family transcriptional regulator [Terrihabitans rhizophilus]|uniref:Crp/Fnr family transcriptional regulator n=1 Tax=Terrihabitans rhizophilus TaxID=3092662 RepID=A0ABU4RTY8_9HYPH|nr:Crp/Fnr family transcriptional regulator [Terrihabitans sp. PJ23]MDX6807130.1 Crp/Fnr family transcriptional regulator [Terrihabitans sp. PJ23]
MDFQTSNHILAALTVEDRSLLRPLLQTVDLPRGAVIEAEDAIPPFVYFLEGGLASILAVTPHEDDKIEVGLYGREGMSGTAILHDVDHGPLRTVIQCAGSAQRVQFAKLQDLLVQRPAISAVFSKWQRVFAVQLAHTALSNGRNSLEKRLARWILMAHDRIGHELDLTHEFLSVMLGVRRAGVTTAIHMLEGEYLIKATRGRIVVLNRVGLKERAGAAYGVPEAYYERVLGRPVANFAEPDQPGRTEQSSTRIPAAASGT